MNKPLSLQATKQEILARLDDYKITALNLTYEKITHQDAKYYEPRDIKVLTDIVLSIEDSFGDKLTEGAQVRTIQLLLDRYGSSTDTRPLPTMDIGVIDA
jgi:hypothetical protein